MDKGFKSCPREGASEVNGEVYVVAAVSSHAPVRGHPDARLYTIRFFWFQVMPP